MLLQFIKIGYWKGGRGGGREERKGGSLIMEIVKTDTTKLLHSLTLEERRH